MAVAGFSTTVKFYDASVALTNEPTTKVTANTVYQITDPAKRLLTPAGGSWKVEVDADGAGAGGYVTADPSTYTVDPLFGVITFASDQGASALVRVSGFYSPLVATADCKEFALSFSRGIEDASVFVSDGHKRKAPTLLDASGSFTFLSATTRSLTPDASVPAINVLSTLAGGSSFFVEIHPGATGSKFRSFVKIESLEEKSSADGLNEVTCKFVCVNSNFINPTANVHFAWGT